MKAALAIVVLVVVCSVIYTEGTCNTEKRARCRQKYFQDNREAGRDREELCDAIHDYKDCVKDAKCSIPLDILPTIQDRIKSYKCGASSITINIAAIMFALFITMKNFY